MPVMCLPMCRISAVGVSAEVYVCRRMTEATGGIYGVAMNENHLLELLLSHGAPPPAPPGQLTAELVRMGFPQQSSQDPATAVYVGADPVLAAGAYTCPRCKSKTQELPCKCHVCNQMLISSPHLARSYHHLFPVKAFVEVSQEELTAMISTGATQVNHHQTGHDRGLASSNGAAGTGDCLPGAAPWLEASSFPCCYGCLKSFVGGDDIGDVDMSQSQGMVLRCPLCRQLFCFDCDAYVHESLHNCPGCEFGAAE